MEPKKVHLCVQVRKEKGTLVLKVQARRTRRTRRKDSASPISLACSHLAGSCGDPRAGAGAERNRAERRARRARHRCAGAGAGTVAYSQCDRARTAVGCKQGPRGKPVRRGHTPRIEHLDEPARGDEAHAWGERGGVAPVERIEWTWVGRPICAAACRGTVEM